MADIVPFLCLIYCLLSLIRQPIKDTIGKPLRSVSNRIKKENESQNKNDWEQKGLRNFKCAEKQVGD